MDTTAIVIIAILACIVVAAFLVYRIRAKVSLKGPAGIGLEIDASNQPAAAPTPSQPGVHIEDATSKKGGILAEDQTGKGAVVKRVEVQDDIIATSTLPKDTPPKA